VDLASSAAARRSEVNAPLPESVRKALESYTLDDKPRSGLRQSHKDTATGEAGGSAAGLTGRGGFGVERCGKEV
jgi:hypothetical protein